jgi:hypothetical protein
MLLANIFDGAAFFAAGAVICFVLLWWRERNLQRAKSLETQALLEAKARSKTSRQSRIFKSFISLGA